VVLNWNKPERDAAISNPSESTASAVVSPGGGPPSSFVHELLEILANSSGASPAVEIAVQI
jgi:hypothetical protein